MSDSDSEINRLQSELSEVQKKLESIFTISQDPALEITNLRTQVMSMSSRCAGLEEEISLLHMTRSNSGPTLKKEKGRFQPEELVQSVMEAKPILSENDHNLLRLLVPIVERMWNGSTNSKPIPVAKPLQESKSLSVDQKRRDDEILKLRKDNEALKEKLSVFELSLDTLTNENMELKTVVTELETQRENLILELAEKEEETEEYRPVLKLKYQLECEKQELQLNNEKLQRQCEKYKKDMEDLTLHTVAETQRLVTAQDGLNSRIAALTSQLQSVNSTNAQLEAVSKTQSLKIEQYKAMEARFAEEHTELMTLRENYKSLGEELEDTKTEHAIYVKKSINEVKALRGEINKERTQKEEIRVTYEKCRQELERIQDIKAAHAKVAAASISEKKFVETLREQVSELQRKNQFLEVTTARNEEVKMLYILEKQKNADLSQENASLKAALSRTNRE